MNPNQFMHQNQILDGLGRSSETIHINRVNILDGLGSMYILYVIFGLFVYVTVIFHNVCFVVNYMLSEIYFKKSQESTILVIRLKFPKRHNCRNLRHL